MEKKMMILGASALQTPAIKKAKELGYQVIAVDYDKDAVGFALADVKLVVSTMDLEEVYRQALHYRPEVVLTSTSDGPVRTAAYVNEKLGKRPDLSYADSFCATVKSDMRRRLEENGVPIPKYYAVEDFAGFCEAVERLGGYCIVKPADNAGSRGVTLLDKRRSVMQRMDEEGRQEGRKEGQSFCADKDGADGLFGTGNAVAGRGGERAGVLEAGLDEKELEEVYAYSRSHSRNGIVMVEEFMTGPEVSVEAFTVEGETSIVTVTDKRITPPPYFVELAHCEPSMLEEGILERIRQVALQAVRAIRLQNGPSHTEIKVTPKGPKVVELAARLGGDFITSKLVPLSTGVDLVGASVELAAGQKTDIRPKWQRGAAIHFIPAKEGVIRRIFVPEEAYGLEGVEEVVFYKKAGERAAGTKSSNDRVGHIITSADTPKKAMETGEKVLRLIQVEWE